MTHISWIISISWDSISGVEVSKSYKEWDTMKLKEKRKWKLLLTTTTLSLVQFALQVPQSLKHWCGTLLVAKSSKECRLIQKRLKTQRMLWRMTLKRKDQSLLLNKEQLMNTCLKSNKPSQLSCSCQLFSKNF